MTEHTYKQFDIEMDEIRSELLRMGGCVESMISDAIRAVVNGDVDLIDRVKENEKEVNKIEVALDDQIATIIARRQPAGIDLRTLMAVAKMLTDMERSGDEAEKIAAMAARLHEGNKKFVPEVELQHMGKAVISMLHEVMDAFARHDSVAAAGVVRSDKQVDKEWKATMRGLISYMIEDPRTISNGIDLLFVARSLERIGDHSKNMAERVIFMVHGADVRHQGVKAAEKAVAESTDAESNSKT